MNGNTELMRISDAERMFRLDIVNNLNCEHEKKPDEWIARTFCENSKILGNCGCSHVINVDI